MTTLSATRQGWTADASTFGARLALVRQHMGWGNVKEAAAACGIPAENWRRWERDGKDPHRLTTIAKQIAGATGCDYRWLALGPDESGGQPGPTGEYFEQSRLVASIGAGDSPSNRRPVTRTRPIGAGRPRTPVAA